MIKRKLLGAATAITMLTMAAGPAQAMDGRAFSIIFYSDANHTEQVGFARAACTPDPVAILQRGTSSDYQEVVYVGECVDGELLYY